MDRHLHVPTGIRVDFCNGCHVVFPPSERNYHLRLSAPQFGIVVFDVDVPPAPHQPREYFARQTFFVSWLVEVFMDGKLIFTHLANIAGRQVCIDLRDADRARLSHWLPSVLKLQDLRNPRLTVVMDARYIPVFRDACPGIALITSAEYRAEDYYAVYPISTTPRVGMETAMTGYSAEDPAAYADSVLAVESERQPLCPAQEEDIAVSVCIPVYNAEKYIGACLDSLLAQTYGNFEILLCDDKSTDDTLLICRKYARLDPRIKVFENAENRGGRVTRNRLFREASGAYTVWGDADDTYSPDFLERGVEALHRKRYDIVELPYEIVPMAGARQFVCMPDREVESGEGLAEFFLGNNRPGRWYLWCKFLRTEIVKESLPPDGRAPYDDIFFGLPLFHHAKSYRFVSLAHPLYHYNVREGGAWAALQFDMTLDTFRKLCEMRAQEVKFNVDFIRAQRLPETLVPPLIAACDLDDLVRRIGGFAGAERETALAAFHAFFGEDGNLINGYPLKYDCSALLRAVAAQPTNP